MPVLRSLMEPSSVRIGLRTLISQMRSSALANGVDGREVSG